MKNKIVHLPCTFCPLEPLDHHLWLLKYLMLIYQYLSAQSNESSGTKSKPE
jgi:hypothetical protein